MINFPREENEKFGSSFSLDKFKPYFKGFLPHVNSKNSLKKNNFSDNHFTNNEIFPKLINDSYFKSSIIHENKMKHKSSERNLLKRKIKQKIENEKHGSITLLKDLILTVKAMKIGNNEENQELNLKKFPLEKLKILQNISSTTNTNNLNSNIQYFKYYIGPGNNSELIRKILNETRYNNWRESTQSKGVIHFRWEQSNKDFKYDRLNSNALYKQIVNHFEYHREISTKSGLIKNLKVFCEQNDKFLFDITPTTFILNLEDEELDIQVQNFLLFYNKYLPVDYSNTKTYLNIDKKGNNKVNFKLISNDLLKNSSSLMSRPIMNKSFMNGSEYLWLLKPNGLNRGRGIKIFSNLDQLEKYINDYINQFKESDKKIEETSNAKEKIKGKKFEKQNEKLDNLIKNYSESQIKKPKTNNQLQTFIIQKYIERPLLINGRKFDIRVWTLVTHNMDIYFFREGYIRTSCEKFDLNPIKSDDFYVHLTNNAIQKNSNNYGLYEPGNQLTFNQLEEIIKTEGKTDFNFKNQLLPKIKEIILMTLFSINKKLNKKERKFSFEIFGYDFMIDENYNTWLIEVNTNPCIETSSPLLSIYLPRMIDDAFKLTIDIIFNNKNNNTTENVNNNKNDGKSIYSVYDYKDEENLWDLLGSLK